MSASDDQNLHLHIETISGAELARLGRDLLGWLHEHTTGALQALAVLDTVSGFLREQNSVMRIEIKKIAEPNEGGKPN